MSARFAVIIFLCCLLLIFCTKKEKNDPLICEKFQMMSEKCENEILEVFSSYIKDNEKNGHSDFDYKLIESRIKKRISQKQGQKQCERLRLSKYPDDNKRFINIKSCVDIKTCREFAGCILTL